MARDAEPPAGKPEPSYWQFPSLEARRRQQFHTIDVGSGVHAWSRSCSRCGQFTIIRAPDGKLDGLSDEQKRFVLENLTTCEAEGRAKHAGTTIL